MRRAPAYAGNLRGTSVVARSAVFQTVVDQDLIFSETAGRNVLGSGTTRTGWLGALRWTGPFFDESANLTLVSATFNDTHEAVAYVPGTVFRSDTALFAPLPWRLAGQPVRTSLSAGITYVGPRPLPYGEVSGDIFTVDGALTVSWSHYQVRLSATNVLDNRYRLGEYNYASDFKSRPQPTLVPEREFTAGAPRALFATFRNQPRSFVMAKERSSRLSLAAGVAISCLCAGCVGNAGGQSIDFSVAAADCRSAIAGQPLACPAIQAGSSR